MAEPDPIPPVGTIPHGGIDVAHVPNHGAHATPEECLAVRTMMDAGHSAAAIGRAINKDPRTIAGIMARVQDPAKYAAAILASGAGFALTQWQAAIPIAASEGKHGPAKDWLLHAGAIQPVNSAPTNVAIQVIVGAPLPGTSTATSSHDMTAQTVDADIVSSTDKS